MNARVNVALFVASAAVVGVGMLRAAGRLPVFGSHLTSYARVENAAAPSERRTPNVPTAITFDYRGFDTLGEEFILFAAVAGAARILDRWRERGRAHHLIEGEPHDVPPDSGDAVRAMALLFGVGTVFLGVSVVGHGYLTPGSGFQGGVVISAGWFLIYLGFGARPFRRLTANEPTDIVEAAGAAAYVFVGIGGILAGSAFLANVLPLGAYGSLLSTGTIAVINAAVGIEVAAGFIALYAHTLDVARTERLRPPGVRR